MKFTTYILFLFLISQPSEKVAVIEITKVGNEFNVTTSFDKANYTLQEIEDIICQKTIKL